jgi:hypothetical protein
MFARFDVATLGELFGVLDRPTIVTGTPKSASSSGSSSRSSDPSTPRTATPTSINATFCAGE